MSLMSEVTEHIDVIDSLRTIESQIDRISNLFLTTLHSNGKILLCGNGGSASDAQHIAAELVGRFMTERAPLPALALTTDSSIVTAIANDYGYEYVFSRQIEAIARPNDLLLVLSTSGNSRNIINAIHSAKRVPMQICALLGGDGGRAASMIENTAIVSSGSTARIQEAHIFIGHYLCSIIDTNFPSVESKL